MKRHILHPLWLVLTLLLSSVAHAEVTELSASVDKNPVLVSESIVLEVVANDHVDQGSLDTSALLKDFVVGRTSVSRQTSMVNFDTTQTTKWQTILIPRQPGRYTIPAFEIDGVNSQPINLQVLPQSAHTQQTHQDVYITTSIDKPTLYLQQQATYTVKLHIAKDLQRGSLTEPKLEQASIRQIGKDKEYSDLINGKRYRIIERNFAIQPQKSGKYVVEGPVFQGEVVTRNRGSSLFNMFNETKPISRLSPTLEIDVQPIPTDYDGHWLPSEFVTLNEEWQPQQQEYILGEPITRTITLTAIGVSEEQLPEISATYPSQVKVYPDKSDTATVEKDKQLIAQRQDSFAIVPSQVGEVQIPEVQVPWFNSRSGKKEYVTLPARTIKVLPDPEQQAAPQIQQPIPQVTPATETTNEVTRLVDNPLWKYSTLAFAVLWALTLLGWIIHAKRFSSNKAEAKTGKESQIQASEAQLWKQLQHALKQNDATKTSQLLLPWLICAFKTDWVNIQQAVNSVGNDKLRAAVSELQLHLYSTKGTGWDAQAMHMALSQTKGNISMKKNDDKLQPLYPQ